MEREIAISVLFYLLHVLCVSISVFCDLFMKYQYFEHCLEEAKAQYRMLSELDVEK